MRNRTLVAKIIVKGQEGHVICQHSI